MASITIRIGPDGELHAETHGIKGKACTAYIRALEDLLDAETIDSSFTSEYHETVEVAPEEHLHLDEEA